MIDSLMTSIDKQSVEWLKSASKDKKSGSFWKSLSRGAKNRINQINRKMTDNSTKNVAKTPSLDKLRQQSSSRSLLPLTGSSDAGGSTGGSTSSSASGSSNVTPGAPATGFSWWWLLVLLAIVGPVVFFLRKQLATVTASSSDAVIRADSIHDRESLLAACHQLAIRTFGLRSCFWNHRKLFQKLMDRIDGRNQIIEQLSQIYERARYAPEQRLTQNDVDRARNLFTQIRGVAGASR